MTKNLNSSKNSTENIQRHGSEVDNNSPLVSVCIPSYNCAEFIEETLQSVFRQTYPNIELIISDDGSADDSVKLIEKTLKQCPENIVVKFMPVENNTGIENSWNRVLEECTGEYIKLLPCDDFMTEECIAEQLKVFQQSDEMLALVYSRRRIISKSGNHICVTGFTYDGVIESKKLIQKSILNGTNLIGEPGAVLFSKSAMHLAGKFNGELPYVIDFDYWCRLLRFGNAKSIKSPMVVFRIDNNLSVRLGINRVKNYIAYLNILKSDWQISSFIIYAGKIRAILNEGLRRLFYIYTKYKDSKGIQFQNS